jgi:hypothetical protein
MDFTVKINLFAAGLNLLLAATGQPLWPMSLLIGFCCGVTAWVRYANNSKKQKETV